MRARTGISHAVLAGLLVACLGLGACGRKGPLEPPPGAVNTQAASGQTAGAMAIGVDGTAGQNPAGATPTEPAEPERHFFLDFLL